MSVKLAQLLSRISGSVLILIAGLAFLPNPFFGPKALMVNDTNMSFVHLALGVILIGMSFTGEGRSAYTLFMSAFVMAGLAVGGYLASNSYSGVANLFDMFYPRAADNYLHGALAAGLVICGKCNTSKKQLFYE
jgi:hypothetical protein